MNLFRLVLLLIPALFLQACQPAPQTGNDAPPPSAAAPEAAPAVMSAAERVADAPENASRSPEDMARDAARKPAEVLAFLGVEPGMTVLDQFASAGWYTEVLSSAVGPEGRVIAQNAPRMLEMREGANEKAISARLADGRLANVERLNADLGELGLEPESLDMAFTALNFHDYYYLMSPEMAANALAEIYAALKPGGVLGLVDHAGAPDGDNAKLHRIDPQIARDMAADAGFILEAESDLLGHPEDDLTLMVFDPTIRGKTDRFVLRLRKPEAS
jgi:predicted methyltransferase